MNIGRAAANEAVARVAKGQPTWLDNSIITSTRWIASKPSGYTFTSNMLRRELDDTREPRVMGALMKRLQRGGLIEPTDIYRASSERINHNRMMRVWRII